MTAKILRTQVLGWEDTDLMDVLPARGQLLAYSDLPGIAGAALIEDVAYFVYVGYTAWAKVATFVKFHVSTGGTGAQTAAEIGLFSTPLPPNGAAQTVTKIVANGTLSDLTGTGVMANTVTLATTIPVRTHLWAAVRTAMATNEPTVYGLTADTSTGQILTTATAGALTSATTLTGALVTASAAWQAPRLVVVFSS